MHPVIGPRALLPLLLWAAACVAQGATPSSGAALPSRPIVAAHYFGEHWPKNFISGFRAGAVAEDFARVRADGFNTVIFVVSWGDFQPIYEPCCTYDERAFQRLHLLLRSAREAGLRVILRVGYAWAFHPASEPTADRQAQLMNRPEVRRAFLDYVARIADEIRPYDHVLFSFMSWEDQWLRTILPSARADLDDYLALLPADTPNLDVAAPPRLDGDSAALFHAYWDWLVMYRFFAPSRRLLPRLSYEVRVDSEPAYGTDAQGQREISGWIEHRGMYRQPGAMPITLYWAPFWGAENRGETLAPERAASLLEYLLARAQERSGGRPLFIDQFNFVDNTLGHEHNAVLAPAEVPRFLAQATCVMQQGSVVGYGIWTTRDYRESPLHNPSFAYGLEGWTLHPRGRRATALPGRGALVPSQSGDWELRLRGGDILTQRIPPGRGRLPSSDDGLADRLCVQALAVGQAGALAADVGAEGAVLRFPGGRSTEQCTPIAIGTGEDDLTLRLRAVGRTELRLQGVWLFDHVQYGGLYDDKARPGPFLDALRQTNIAFAAGPVAAACAP
jgi:hypothetical protein